MLKTVYEHVAIGKTQVFEWFFRFKRREISIDHKPPSAYPSTVRTDKNIEKWVKKILTKDLELNKQIPDRVEEWFTLKSSELAQTFFQHHHS